MLNMIRDLFSSESAGQGADKLTRIDLAVMSLMSLLFGLAVIVKGLLAG